MTDQQLYINHLCKACIDGDTKAFKGIYDACSKVFFGICLRYAGDRMKAQDLLQEGFIKIYEGLSSFDPEKGNFYTWGSRVIVNTILMEKRKKRIVTEELTHETSLREHYDDSAIENLSYAELVSYLQKLPEGYRVIFNMYVIEEYTHAEIAELLGISVSTSKTQLMKAKKMLGNLLRDASVIPAVV